MSQKKDTITIFNNTEHDFKENSSELLYRGGDDTSDSCPKAIPAGSKVQVELPKNKKSGVHGYTVFKLGFKWKNQKEMPGKRRYNRGESVTQVVPGGEYEIVIDEENPPLEPEEQDEISREIVNCLENGVEFAKIWEEIVKRLPKIAGKRTPEQLKYVYDGDKKSWIDWYNPPEVVDVKPIIPADGPYRVDVYWRALDRFPGGNADIFVFMIRFFSDGTVYAIKHSDWDQCHRKEGYVPVDLAKKKPLKTIEKLLSDYKGSNNSEFNIGTQSSDDEEYDTEWSSIEVLVYSPIPSSEEWGVRFRLHQREFTYEERNGPKKSKLSPVEPSKEQKAILDGINEMVGITRVNQFSDAGDGQPPCKAREEYEKSNKKNLDDGGLPYLHPLYFHYEFPMFENQEEEEGKE